MYKTDIPIAVKQVIAVFHALKLWTVKEDAAVYETALKFFHFIYFVSFVLSIVVRTVLTDDKDDRVIMTAAAIIAVVHICRLWYTISKKNEILALIWQLGAHSTNDREMFHQIMNKLNNWMNFARFIISMCTSGVVLLCIFPLLSSEKIVLFNIAFPTDREQRTAFWIAHSFNVVGSSYAVLCFFVSVIVWYLMINGAVKYQLLGDQLRNMGVANVTINGTSQNRKHLKTNQQNQFLEDLIEAIRTHQKVKE